jgi:glycosyltransferase involved in cell wall biosynthesis
VSTVLFVCAALNRGGAERQWSHLLPALAERGHRVRLLALSGTGPFFDEIRAQGIEARSAGLRSRWDVRRLLAVLQRTPPADVVVSQGVNALVVGQALAWRFSAPHVAIDHTPPGLRRPLHRRLLTRLVAPHVSTLVAVADAQLAELERLGYRAQRTTVVHNGVPTPQPSRPRTAVREELGLSDDDVAVFLVATLRAQKNIPLFVEAVRAAAVAAPSIRAFIAGGGPELARVRELAGNAGIRVLGERDDVPDLLAAADVVCLSSFTEAFPMVLLEAMALGRPAISTDVGGVREAVVDGETGLLVPPGDVGAFSAALRTLATDRALRARLGENARATHERFTLESMVDGYEHVIKRAAGSR